MENTLLEWKNQTNRKPLLLQGVRQVGKTYILEHFGKEHFEHCVLLDFAENVKLNKLFEPNLDPQRIIQDISIHFDMSISLDNTLLIFDEIQLCPNALTSLKYLYKEFPNAYICASGSLLGLGLSEADFPVGKVQREFMYPMSFFEFLEGIGESRILNALLDLKADTVMSEFMHDKSNSLLKEYFIIGGLPEVVNVYRENRDNLNVAYRKVRKLQKDLIASYLDDIAKQSGNLKAVRIAAVFRNIPDQLAKENKNSRKFVFKDVIPKDSNYTTLEGPIEWLSQAGLVHRVPICNKCQLPLSAYTKANCFVLYMFDVGILGAMLALDPVVLRDFDFGQFKGYIAENFVLLEFLTSDKGPVYSWRENTAEIEFLLQLEGDIIPVEVKSGINTKAKSLRFFKEKYNPSKSLLLSGLPKDYYNGEHLRLPLYMTSTFT